MMSDTQEREALPESAKLGLTKEKTRDEQVEEDGLLDKRFVSGKWTDIYVQKACLLCVLIVA